MVRCVASPGCRSPRGISWQSLALNACSQTVLHAKVARLWQGCTSLEIEQCFPTEPELMSRGCTDEAMPARAAQNQKQQVALQGFCACVKKPAGQHMMQWLISGIQPIQLLPVPEILHHLTDPSPGSVCWSSLVNTLLRTLPKEMFRRKYRLIY